jgi:predicted transcriptional regulator
MMRTTIDLPEDLHRIAASIARDKHQTLSQAVADLLRRALARTDKPELSLSPITGLPVIHVGRPITIEDVRSLDDEE